MGTLVDLSHAVEHGVVTYRGLPAPEIGEFLSREESRRNYARGTSFHIGRIDMVGNSGTYLDAPFHRYEDGRDLAELPLGSMADLEAVVVRHPEGIGRAIGSDILGSLALRGKAVLVHTGWAQHWRTERYFDGHPFLTENAAQRLVDAGAALVGIDSYNIDDTTDGRRPVHSALLAAGLPIVEHLRGLDRLPESGFRFFAVAVKVRGLGSFPVRAFAILPEGGPA
jgi:arylformamidase